MPRSVFDLEIAPKRQTFITKFCFNSYRVICSECRQLAEAKLLSRLAATAPQPRRMGQSPKDGLGFALRAASRQMQASPLASVLKRTLPPSKLISPTFVLQVISLN